MLNFKNFRSESTLRTVKCVAALIGLFAAAAALALPATGGPTTPYAIAVSAEPGADAASETITVTVTY